VDAYLRAIINIKSRFYALLTARQHENARWAWHVGEMSFARTQKTINFASQKIPYSLRQQCKLSSALKKYLFGRVVALVKQEMASSMTTNPSSQTMILMSRELRVWSTRMFNLKTLIEYLEIPANC